MTDATDFLSLGSKETARHHAKMTMLEMVMRFSPPAVALAVGLALVSSVSHGKRGDDVIKPLSVSMTADGKAALAAERYDAAVDALESALAVDPRNRDAIVTLALVAQKQGLTGKAIRYYREALLIEPNDVAALAGQGKVLVERGALAKAKLNLTRITQLCATVCPEQTVLAAAIEKGSQAPAMAVQDVTPKPIVETAPKP
jgi:Tfp pilus assembly protein PilF